MPVVILKVRYNRHTRKQTSAEITGPAAITEEDYQKRLITAITGMTVEDSVKAFLEYVKSGEGEKSHEDNRPGEKSSAGAA